MSAKKVCAYVVVLALLSTLVSVPAIAQVPPTSETDVSGNAATEASGTKVMDAVKQCIDDVVSEVAAQDEVVVPAASITNDNEEKSSVPPTETGMKDSATADDSSSPQAPRANTLSIEGAVIPYVWTPQASRAPSHGAGVWMGDDDVNDGSYCYFIGHHPGDFAPVMSLDVGDSITVCDGSGDVRTYQVIDRFDVENTMSWNGVKDRVTCHGESCILQTCVGDEAHYRIVVAA